VAEQHTGMDGEVVDALLRLLDQRIAVHVPGQLFRNAANLLECLIDGHRADRDRRVAQNPLARLVDLLPGREVHDRVRAPERGPAQLLDLLLDRGRDDAVADVRVDLHVEGAADDHRRALRVIDVGWNDRAAARDFAADELRIEAFADRDELHLGCDDAVPRVVELGGAAAGLCAQGDVRARAGGGTRMLPPGSVIPRWRSLDVSAVRLGNDLHVAAPEDPVEAQLRQTAPRVVALWTARVVHAQRRLAAGQRDLPHRHADAMRPF